MAEPRRKSIAVVADIHGNTAALEAVLDDIRSRGIDIVLNLGDSLYGPLDPAGTFSLNERSGLITISGNEDRSFSAMITNGLPAKPAPTAARTGKNGSGQAKTIDLL